MISGVYKITNCKNNKVYIGSSANIKRRIGQHKNCLAKGKHKNKHLQNSYTKHGGAHFRFEVICYTKDLLEVEQKWIEHFNSCDPKFGYNIAKIAGSTKGFKHSKEFKAWQSKNVKELWDKGVFSKKTAKRYWDGLALSEKEAQLTQLKINRESTKDQRAQSLRAYSRSKDVRDRLSAQGKRVWEIPGFREKLSQAQANYWDQNRSARSEEMKKRWADPDYKNKMCAIRKDQVTDEFRKAQSERQKKQWKKDGYREEFIEKIKKTTQSESYRKSQSIKNAQYRYHIISPEGEDFLFYSLVKAEKDLGLSYSGLMGVMTGQYKQCKGWTGHRILLTKEEKDDLVGLQESKTSE